MPSAKVKKLPVESAAALLERYENPSADRVLPRFQVLGRRTPTTPPPQAFNHILGLYIPTRTPSNVLVMFINMFKGKSDLLLLWTTADSTE